MLLAMIDASGVEIEGNAEDLRELVRQLRESAGVSQIVLEEKMKDNERGVNHINALILSVNREPVAIEQLYSQILFSGSKDKLFLLAENIDWLANNPRADAGAKVSDHIHLEYYPGHLFLAESALPLVVTRRDSH